MAFTSMDIIGMLWTLTKEMCVIVVVAYFITRSGFFKKVLNGQFDYKVQLLLVVIFGLLSIYGTYDGIPILGAVVNIRDLGPMIAGLIGGPIVGLGAGLIGGTHRFLLGGFTQYSCSISTVLAGLLGGAIFILNKRKIVSLPVAVSFAVMMEVIHMGMALLIARPFDQAVALVTQAIVPMTVANGLGMAIFFAFIWNLIREREAMVERDAYRDELERKRTELNIARDIQQSFLPDTIPELKGYDIAALSIPAQEVGGDFYDFITISENKIGFTIADVSGKSVPAALFMALSRAIVRSNALWSHRAKDVISQANNLITQDSKSGMFVTLFYAILDVKDRTLTYVNAGHNPPYLMDGAGDLRMLKVGGIALGARAGVDYEEIDMKIESGYTFVFYTDGVTDANNDRSEMYGEERLYSVIKANSGKPAKDIIEAIKADVLAFCRNTPQYDDITLMILKVV